MLKCITLLTLQLDIALLIFLLFLSRADAFIYIPDINMSYATSQQSDPKKMWP